MENKDAEGRIIRKYHDDLGRVIKEEVAYGNESIKPVTYQYDSLGNVISIKNADGEEIKYYYNELNQVVKTVAGSKELEIINKVEYDYLGRKTKTIDGENNEIRYDYDLIGRLTKVTSGVNSKSPQTTKYQYDIRTQVNNQAAVANKVVDALNRESVTYFDSLGRKIKEEILADTSTTDKKEVLYEYYSGGGNLKKIVKPGKENTVEYMYDGLDRINKIIYKKENSLGDEK